jgi:ABC-type phosphate transport system substrate-binding protein
MKALIMIFALSASLSVGAAELWVVTGKVRATALKRSLTQDEVREIFLAKRKRIEEWRPEPVDQASSEEIRKRFYQLVVGKGPAEIQTYWAEMVFSGKAKAPRSVGNGAGVVRHITANPDAIGYLSSDTPEAKELGVVYRVPL